METVPENDPECPHPESQPLSRTDVPKNPSDSRISQTAPSSAPKRRRLPRTAPPRRPVQRRPPALGDPSDPPSPAHPACQLCRRFEFHDGQFVAPQRLRGTEETPLDLVVVTKAPTLSNGIHLRSWGDLDQHLCDLLQAAGLRPERTLFTTAVRCGDPTKKPPTPHHIKCCKPFLQHALSTYTPPVTVLFGDAALRAGAGNSGISRYQGIPIAHPSTTLIPAYDPLYVLQDGRYASDLTQALTRTRTVLQDIRTHTSIVERLRKRYHTVQTKAEVDRVCTFLRQQTFLAFDSEYYPLFIWDPWYTVLGMSFSWGPGTGVFFPIDHPESPFLGNPYIKERLVDVLEHTQLIAHNVEVDARAAVALGADVWKLNVVFETYFASAAVRGPEAGHGLKHLASLYADTGGYEEELETFKRVSMLREKTPEHPDVLAHIQRYGNAIFEEQRGYASIPLRILANPYGCGDSDTTWQVFAKLVPELHARNQWEWYTRYLLPSWRANYFMHQHGLLLDEKHWQERYAYFSGTTERVLRDMLSIPQVATFKEMVESKKKSTPFSLGSDEQMRTLFFLHLGLSASGEKTDGGKDSVKKESLQTILAQSQGHPAVRLLLEHKSAAKPLQTLEGMRKRVDATGRMHPVFSSVSRSGRRRSSDPNVQNITAGGYVDPIKNLRMCIAAGDGRQFVSVDWAQLEMRLAACASQDPTLLQCCRDSDPHHTLATELSIPRKPAKTVNFAMLYGASAERLQSQMYKDLELSWSTAYCEDIILRTKTLYAVLFSHIQTVGTWIDTNGYIVSILGNRRDFPYAINSTNKQMASRARREGWNHVIQSVGHDLLSVVIDELLHTIHNHQLDWRLENELHDQFLVNTPTTEADAAGDIMQMLMETIPKKLLGTWLQVPLPAEVAIGSSYGELRERKPPPSNQKVQE